MADDPVVERLGVGIAHVKVTAESRQRISSGYSFFCIRGFKVVAAGRMDFSDGLGDERKVVRLLQAVFPVAGGIVSEWITIPSTHNVFGVSSICPTVELRH